MSDREDAFWREVNALAEYDEMKCRMDPMASANYPEMAAYFREVARRAMTCAALADEASQEAGEDTGTVITNYPALEPD